MPVQHWQLHVFNKPGHWILQDLGSDLRISTPLTFRPESLSCCWTSEQLHHISSSWATAPQGPGPAARCDQGPNRIPKPTACTEVAHWVPVLCWVSVLLSKSAAQGSEGERKLTHVGPSSEPAAWRRRAAHPGFANNAKPQEACYIWQTSGTSTSNASGNEWQKRATAGKAVSAIWRSNPEG